MFNVRETCKHFFGSRFEPFAAYLIHRKEAECLREWYTVGSGMQKFNLGIYLSQNCSQSHFTKRSRRNTPFNKQSRSPCQREALNDTNEPLVIDREDCFLLVGDTDPRWSVFVALVDLLRHCKQNYNWLQSSQRYLSVSAKTLAVLAKDQTDIESGGALMKSSRFTLHPLSKQRLRSLGVTLVIVAIIVIFFAVVFLVWFFPKKDIGWCRASRIVCVEALWAYSAHAHMVLCARWQEQRVLVGRCRDQLAEDESPWHVQKGRTPCRRAQSF